MATIGDLPCVLLYQIIFLVVRSSLGVVDLARVISVCRDFFAYADDERLLKVVSFDILMDCKKYYKYQHVNSLLVKCSNISAQFLLGKVILLSSARMLLSERPTWYSATNLSVFARLGQNFATDFYDQSIRDISFVKYFLPAEASKSESSHTRLVHYQLVKVFLRNSSYHDVLTMQVYLKCYLIYFSNQTGRNHPLLYSFELMVFLADILRKTEKAIKTEPEDDDSFWLVSDTGAGDYLESLDQLLYNIDRNFD